LALSAAKPNGVRRLLGFTRNKSGINPTHETLAIAHAARDHQHRGGDRVIAGRAPIKGI
jgi:hypothetical protein